MADAMTTTASLDFDQAMWDRAAYRSLRPQLYFDMFADVKTSDAAPDRGATLTFTTLNDMSVATTPLNESVDVDAVAPTDTQTTLTLAEYGNAANTTFKVRATSFIALDPEVAELIGFNAGISLDTLARVPIQAGSNIRYALGTGAAPAGRANVAPNNTLRATDVRRAFAELSGANVVPFGGYYAAIIHPDVAFDLKQETGSGAWRTPREYVEPANIWNGEMGMFEGFRFMASPRAPLFADAGSSTTLTDVYGTLFFGRQAIAKAYSTYEGRGAVPIVIQSPVVDKLKRFQPLGWHWFGAYGRFREAALRRVESASSIGANA